MQKIIVLDTTLRDGEQAPGFSMKREQKLELALQLERMKVDIIEAGFPISSQEDFASVREIAKTIKSCSVAGFCRATAGDISCAYDAVKHSEKPRLNIFLATSDIHIKHKLCTTREEVLRAAVEAVRFARKYCGDIEFIAEDATRSDRDFLLEIFSRVSEAGASTVVIADTVGFAMPPEIAEMVELCSKKLSGINIGVHCHDDMGMATANTLAAVKAGALHVECTINGIGERAGMAAIEEVVMALKTRGEHFGVSTGIVTREFLRASKLLGDIVDFSLPPNKAIVGENAFAHEAGIHQAGMLQNPLTYEIMQPSDIGRQTAKLVLGKHSGKKALRERLSELGYETGDMEMDEIFARFKQLADSKRIVTDMDLEKLVYGEIKTVETYSLLSFVINSGTNITSTAVVRLLYHGQEIERAAMGQTPVIAAFNAVDKISRHSYPLHHFSIQSISEGRTELGESSVQIWNDGKLVTGRGVDTDIVEACIKAYLNAINKAVSREKALTEARA